MTCFFLLPLTLRCAVAAFKMRHYVDARREVNQLMEVGLGFRTIYS